MSKGRQVVLFISVAAFALAAGFFFNPWSRLGGPESGSAGPLLAATFPDLDGKPRALSEWRGKVLVVNFWATWCPPCLKEIPEFVRMQQALGDRGLQFVGIALDDPAKVREFVAGSKMNYPVLIGGLDVIDFARLAGNRSGGLPFTIVVDRNGQLVRADTGGLTELELRPVVERLL